MPASLGNSTRVSVIVGFSLKSLRVLLPRGRHEGRGTGRPEGRLFSARMDQSCVVDNGSCPGARAPVSCLFASHRPLI